MVVAFPDGIVVMTEAQNLQPRDCAYFPDGKRYIVTELIIEPDLAHVVPVINLHDAPPPASKRSVRVRGRQWQDRPRVDKWGRVVPARRAAFTIAGDDVLPVVRLVSDE